MRCHEPRSGNERIEEERKRHERARAHNAQDDCYVRSRSVWSWWFYTERTFLTPSTHFSFFWCVCVCTDRRPACECDVSPHRDERAETNRSRSSARATPPHLGLARDAQLETAPRRPRGAAARRRRGRRHRIEPHLRVMQRNVMFHAVMEITCDTVRIEPHRRVLSCAVT